MTLDSTKGREPVRLAWLALVTLAGILTGSFALRVLDPGNYILWGTLVTLAAFSVLLLVMVVVKAKAIRQITRA